MFEELLKPVDAFTFKKTESHQEWISSDGFFLTNYSKSKNQWQLIFAKYNLPTEFYKTKLEAVRRGYEVQSKYYTCESKTLERAGFTAYDLMSDGQVTPVNIRGGHMRWSIYHNVEQVLSASVPQTFIKQYFETRKQIIVYLRDALNLFLPDIIKHAQYVNKLSVDKNSLWWMHFIKKEISIQDLENIFSTKRLSTLKFIYEGQMLNSKKQSV